MKAKQIVLLLFALVILLTASAGLTSCGLFHNENDWAFHKRGVDFPSHWVPGEIADKH